MLRNNIRAFLTHLAVVTLFLLLILLMMLFADATASVFTGLAFSGLLLKIYFVLSFLAPTGLYLWVGGRFRSEGSPLRDFLSVASVAVIGVFLWGYSLHAVSSAQAVYGRQYSLFTPAAEWMYYLVYNPVADGFLVLMAAVKSLRGFAPWVMLILAFYPSFVMWIGLRRWGER